jgi:ankyrin repeat protein
MNLSRNFALVCTVFLFCAPRLFSGQQANVSGGLDAQLVAAAGKGDTATVQSLLQQGANIEARDNYGETALMEAAGRGHTDTAILLLDKGANIEAKDNYSATALVHAAESGHTDTVILLLDKGANIEAADKDGYTALMRAAGDGYADMAKVLLERGAKVVVAQQSNSPGTPDAELLEAAGKGDTATVQSLLQQGTSIEAKDKNGRTALMWAAEMDEGDTAGLLLGKGANIEAKDNSGDTALIEAATSGQTDTVKLLLEKGANIEAKDNGGDTALIEAATRGQTDTVKLLLDKGANIEAKDNSGETALIGAADNGKTDAVRFLLGKGANIEAKTTPYGFTALIGAAGDGEIDILQLLLDKGANIEAKTNDGYTALMWAANEGQADEVNLLVDKGANIEAKDNGGRTALIEEARDCKTDMVGLLINRGANIEAKDNNDGYSALMRAALEGCADTVKLLLEKGANTQAKDIHFGETALDVAKDANHADIVSMIQQADPRGTFTQYLAQFKALHANDNCSYCSDAQRNPDDSDLRQQIIKLALTLDPKPTVPDAAAVAAAKGKTIFTNASSPDDLKAAAAAYADASVLAPWVADYYYNEGLALETAKQYDDAIHVLNFYLIAAPSASDANDVRGRIEGIKYEKEKAANQTAPQATSVSPPPQSGNAPVSAENNVESNPENLSGNWDCQSGCDSATVTVNGAILNAVIEAEDVAPNTCAYDESGKCGTALMVRVSGSISVLEITGTMMFPRMRDTQTNCDLPATSESLTGTISPDGRSIALTSSEPTWQTNADRSLFGVTCSGVSRGPDTPEFIGLTRSSSASFPEGGQPTSVESASARADGSAGLFKEKCDACHAAGGGGYGFMGMWRVPDLQSEKVQGQTDEQLTDSIANGNGKKMPAYKGELTAEQMEGLVAYVRSLAQPSKGLGGGGGR